MPTPATHRDRRHAPPLLATAFRRAGIRVRDVRTTLGVAVFAGGLVAGLGMLLFAWLASFVHGGRTQTFDDAALHWMGAHRVPWIEATALEVTFLGTGTVVCTVAGVAALFLALTRQRVAAWLLVWATVGALVLNNVLKAMFHRPRPELFAWGTHVATTSFPSGHAMSAAAVYGTVALLAARLTRRRGVRVAVYVVCGLLVALVAASRMYLGVHYPSDVAAGLVIGAAWAGFCAALLDAAGQAGRRRRRSDTAPPSGRLDVARPDGAAPVGAPTGAPQDASIRASTRS